MEQVLAVEPAILARGGTHSVLSVPAPRDALL